MFYEVIISLGNVVFGGIKAREFNPREDIPQEFLKRSQVIYKLSISIYYPL